MNVARLLLTFAACAALADAEVQKRDHVLAKASSKAFMSLPQLPATPVLPVPAYPGGAVAWSELQQFEGKISNLEAQHNAMSGELEHIKSQIEARESIRAQAVSTNFKNIQDSSKLNFGLGLLGFGVCGVFLHSVLQKLLFGQTRHHHHRRIAPVTSMGISNGTHVWQVSSKPSAFVDSIDKWDPLDMSEGRSTEATRQRAEIEHGRVVMASCVFHRIREEGMQQTVYTQEVTPKMVDASAMPTEGGKACASGMDQQVARVMAMAAPMAMIIALHAPNVHAGHFGLRAAPVRAPLILMQDDDADAREALRIPDPRTDDPKIDAPPPPPPPGSEGPGLFPVIVIGIYGVFSGLILNSYLNDGFCPPFLDTCFSLKNDPGGWGPMDM